MFKFKLNKVKAPMAPTLIKVTSEKGVGHKKGLFKCNCDDCSNEFIAFIGNVKKGLTKSCGCYNKKLSSQRAYKHGYAPRGKARKLHDCWSHMLQRCNNPNERGYHNYGGRGISVCKRWYKFENFLEDMGEPPTKMHSIERINNDGDYNKRNCRWASKIEQANKRTNVYVVFKGEKMTLSRAYKLSGTTVSYTNVRNRFSKLGWSLDKALNWNK